MNLLLRSILATAVLLPFDAIFEGAEAASVPTCNNYIETTKARVAQAKQNQCGFWGGNFNKLASGRWCASSKEETVKDTMESDGQRIGKCTTCRGYSDRANQAARDNVDFRCGFSGPSWGIGSGDANDGHFQWCMALSTTTKGFGMEYAAGIVTATPWSTARGEEEGARNAGIKACIATARDRFSEREKSECEDYANTAVIMANFNANNKCGASVEGRWTLLKEQHFMWCLPRIGTNDGKAMIESETKIRETGAQACKAGGKLKPSGDVLWKGPPIRALGKRKPKLDPKEVNIDPEPGMRQKKGDSGAVKKNPGSGGISTSKSNDAMDRLGGGTGNVPNLAQQPKNAGSGGPTLAAPSPGGRPAPTAGPSVNTPSVPAAPQPRSSGPAPGIDYGGAPKQSGTKVW